MSFVVSLIIAVFLLVAAWMMLQPLLPRKPPPDPKRDDAP